MESSFLAVGFEREPLARLGSAAASLGLVLEPAPTGSEALELARGRAFRLAVCRYPLPDLTMAAVVRGLRLSSSLNRHTPMLILAGSGMEEEARQQVSFGPFLVLPLSAPATSLHAAIGQLLELQPRRRIDLVARLSVEDGGAGVRVDARVVNISLSGMLLDRSPLLPVSTRCRFELCLSGSPVCGTAQVVRHSRPGRERVHGFAVRFLDFDGPDQQRLSARLAAND